MSAPGVVTALPAYSARELVLALHALRGAAGQADYAPQVIAALARLMRAQQGWWLAEAAGAWRLLAQAHDDAAASDPSPDPLRVDFGTDLAALAQRARTQGFASLPQRSAQGATQWLVAVQPERAASDLWLLCLPDRERPHLNELVLRAQLVADLPAPGEAPAASATPAAGDTPLVTWAPLLDAVLFAQAHDGFEPATLALVNALASTLGAQQVALGWRAEAGAALRLVALSHRDKLDRFAHAVVLTEGALDEALDHDEGLRVDAVQTTDTPGTELAGVERTAPQALPAHRLLQQSLGNVSLASLPLASGHSAPRAALLMVFDGEPLPADQLARLRLALRAALPWLESLYFRERALTLRASDELRRRARLWLGPQHLGLKLGAGVGALALLVALFVDWDYRVGASAQLATDSTRILSAQFDGRVEEALVSAGQAVKEGELLAQLDVRDLQNQAADARAEVQRYTAEADKARASGALAEAEVGNARTAQAQARLARTVELIELAANRAPFDGVVVEGEKRELQGAPVRKGDKLYRLARVEKLYATLQVPERDAAQLKAGALGELSLMTRPDEKIPLRVAAVIPVAQIKGQEGNQFMVRAELLSKPADWWRPGMSGNARIEAGPRRIIWVLTHRLVDQLRLWLWW
ncbi:efflux RND transporter periplasmic adaptor subunit [Roseateles sp. DXS20W]|uniref:Efflux RND transporter periplasmic adaptor subunit n=1 Tax=Pelomonas lactea TaxID=3299030 RepID=A0ABW7GKV0_9BURK